MTVIRPALAPFSPASAATTATITLVDAAPGLQRLALGVVLVGTVTGRVGHDVTQLETSEGPVRWRASPPLPPGSTVVLQVASNGPPTHLAILAIRPPESAPAAAGLVSPMAATLGLEGAALIHRWPAIEAANAALPNQLPIPRPGPHLAAAIARFALALREVDFDRWIDRRMVRAIETGAGAQIAARIREDFTALADLASRSQDEAWQSLVLPFLFGADLQQARLYLGGRGPSGEESQAPRRFLLQLATGPFGWMQLDGLVGHKRFDLIVRSEQAMPEPVRSDLDTIFAAAIAQAGYAGLLEITSGSAAPIPAIAHLAAGTSGLLA